MRRSCAPSVRKAEKRKIEECSPTKSPAARNTHEQPRCEISNVAETKRLKGNKIVFNIQWRKVSRMKHKTWKGNGIVEVLLDRNRIVLLDHTGKYMGASEKFKISDLAEGFQMRIGDKEIEFLDQIDSQNEYWAARKTLVENRGWGNEEYEPPEEKKKSQRTSFSISVPTINLRSEINCSKSKSENCPLRSSFVKKTSVTEGNGRGSVPVSECLAKILRPHQWEGVEFLYRILVEDKENLESYGCILADEMGLGKTLQVLTVANTLLRQNDNVKRVLIVSPRSLIGNWNNEIYKWLHGERMYGFIVDGSSANSNKKLSSYAKQKHVPFVIVSYETLISQLEEFRTLNFDLIICDEGHRLKNAATRTYKALRELNIKRCILLTGTPVQNVLSEFYVLADFVNPGIFGNHTEFRKHFEMPIDLGQSSTATEEQKRISAERAEELKLISSRFMIRRLQNVNSNYLPKKKEYICLFRPSKLQHLLLRKAIQFYDTKKELASQDLTPLEMIAILRKICNHPYLLKSTKKDNTLTRSLTRHMSCNDVQQMNPMDSTKLLFVQNLLLKAVFYHREKVVLVSYHTKTLSILQKLCEIHSLNFVRLDGSTPTTERNAIVSKFNKDNIQDEDNAFVLLLSAKAGGTGLNLIGASRLILYDIDWNPANDLQALSRIWRDGQRKDVHIYRLITAGCIEEKIFQRQMAKTSLSDLLAPKTDVTSSVSSMKFSSEELQELFYLQYDYNTCDTHQTLKCPCMGDGQNHTDLDDPSPESTKINELMRWRHWQPDFKNTIIKDDCLWSAKEDLIYLFSNETTTGVLELDDSK